MSRIVLDSVLLAKAPTGALLAMAHVHQQSVSLSTPIKANISLRANFLLILSNVTFSPSYGYGGDPMAGKSRCGFVRKTNNQVLIRSPSFVRGTCVRNRIGRSRVRSVGEALGLNYMPHGSQVPHEILTVQSAWVELSIRPMLTPSYRNNSQETSSTLSLSMMRYAYNRSFANLLPTI